jgi:5-methylcytosine-specific restriction endonuclease McrA
VSRSPIAADGEAIGFAEKVFGLLAETKYTTTYKLAVLLGLMDLCLEKTTHHGPPDLVTTRELAEKVAEIYWPHTLPFRVDQRTSVLRQGNSGQAEIISFIERFRVLLADGSIPLMKAKVVAGEAYSRLVDRIEWKLIEMPLPRVQFIGATMDPFIYEINWDKSVKYRDIVKYQKEHLGFDNRILFRSRVAENFVRLNGLLRPLLHRRWARMVATLNHQEDSRLEEFLFGAERLDLSQVRAPIWEIQYGHCFYCHERIRDPRQAQVDHFIPWSRYPENGIFNLVVADPKCNNDKSDFLSALKHVESWAERFQDQSSIAADLQSIETRLRWDLSRARTLGVARAIYLRLRQDAKLWRIRKDFVNAEPELIAHVFSELADSN